MRAEVQTLIDRILVAQTPGQGLVPMLEELQEIDTRLDEIDIRVTEIETQNTYKATQSVV